MAADLTTLAAVLKESYVIDMITDELNNSVEAWSEFDSTTLKWEGSDAIMPLRVARNASVSASSNTNTPTAGQQGYLRLVVTAKQVYGTIQITGPAMAAAASQKGSFAIEAAAEMEGLISDFRKKLAQLTFAGGPVIGYVWQKQNAATFGYAGRFADILVGAGELVTFVRMDTYATVGVATQLNAISGTSLTLNANIDTTAVAAGVPIAVVVTGAQAVAVDGLNAEPAGFIGNLSAQSHFGIDRTVAGPAGSSTLRSNFRMTDPAAGAGGAALALDDLQNMLANAVTNSGKRFSAFWMSWLQLTSYTTLLQGTSAGNLRVDVKGGGQKADPGFTDFAYANIPIKCSDVCPNGLVFGIEKAGWTRATLSEGHWVDFGQGPIQRVPNKDDGTGTYAMYYDLVCRQPNAQAVLTALSLA